MDEELTFEEILEKAEAGDPRAQCRVSRLLENTCNIEIILK